MAKKKFLTNRTQIAIVGCGLWLLLACWTISAFWEHIGTLKLDTQFGAKCGAMAGEFALLALVLWHAFNKHIGVRKWALIFGFILSAVMLIHAGALYGMKDAQQAADRTTDKIASKLGEVASQQSKDLGASAASQSSALGQTSSRNNAVTVAKQQGAIAQAAAQEQGEIARHTQDLVAQNIVKSDQAVKLNSILPMWYLNGWMYSALFILALLFVSITVALMQNEDDVDADYDGKPDVPQVQASQPAPVRQSPALSDEWAGVQADRQARQSATNQRGHMSGVATPVSRHGANVATPTPSVATPTGPDKGMIWLRQSLNVFAKDGHFYFKAERKKSGVLVRQFSTGGGREVTLHSYMFSQNIADPARQIPLRKFINDLHATLIKRGFNLDYEKGV